MNSDFALNRDTRELRGRTWRLCHVQLGNRTQTFPAKHDDNTQTSDRQRSSLNTLSIRFLINNFATLYSHSDINARTTAEVREHRIQVLLTKILVQDLSELSWVNNRFLSRYYFNGHFDSRLNEYLDERIFHHFL